jgi:hypothetical protein
MNFTTINNPADFFDKIAEEDDGKRTELKNYLKIITNNYDRMVALTSIASKTVLPLTDDEKNSYSVMIIRRLISGDMKVDGEENNWNCGSFGSRWFDWDSPDGKTTCRVAFYSKKYSNGWNHTNPYRITLTFEEQ